MMVLLFRSRASMTVRSLSSAPVLGMHNRGIAFRPCASFHHPALVYHWVFSRSMGNSAAEHRGGLSVYRASGSMRGMWWFTSRRGGSSGGGGPKVFANLLSHSWRRGSSSSFIFSNSLRGSEGVLAWTSCSLGFGSTIEAFREGCSVCPDDVVLSPASQSCFFCSRGVSPRRRASSSSSGKAGITVSPKRTVLVP